MALIRQKTLRLTLAIVFIAIAGTAIVFLFQETAKVPDWKDSEISASILESFRMAVHSNINAKVEVRAKPHRGWTELKVDGALTEAEKTALTALAQQIGTSN